MEAAQRGKKLVLADPLFGDGGHDEIPTRLDAARALIAAHRLGLGIALVAFQRAPPYRAGSADTEAFHRLPA